MLSTVVLHTELNAAEIRRGEECAQKRYAENTHIAIEQDTASLRAFCAKRFPHVTDVRGCTVEHVWAFMVEQEKSGMAITTMQRRLANLRTHVVQLTKEQWVELDKLFDTMRRDAAGTGTGQVGKDALMGADIAKLVATCTTDSRVDVRDRAFLLFGFNTGMRRGELAALRWDDLNFQPKGVIARIRRSKTDQFGKGDQISVLVKPDPQRCAVAALLKWQAHAGSKGQQFVFPGRYGKEIEHSVLWKLIKRRCALAGLDGRKYGAHSLRSGMITQAASNGAPINKVKFQARHSALSSTSRYMKQTELLADDSVTSWL